ncbi:glucose dehydrogenase [FAD, quinone]-like [Thrips palmi]|uniref:Glucose dehydrogenase [FAD, quinone]-like n=1 Tax=Thrips palmi TaxID=161013 RepID=A0A6P8Y4T9_THRPL|nr:glucose dehydrogenase [FAD, quinone]-like [Thrips palmi]
MDAASNATAVAALQCPASSPVLLFLAGVLASINNKREAERAQRRQEGNGALSEYDYVVVGGGSSGCAVAARLSEDRSVSVLLLERGGREPEEARVPAYSFNNIKSDMAEVYRAEPESQNCNSTGCVINVPAVLGGGSTLNGMLYVRGSKEDYEEWARLTEDRGWAYDSVLQYFKKAEDNLNPTISENRRYHGRGGPQKVSWEPYRHPAMPLFQRAFQAAGVPFRLDINAESQLGHSVVQTTTAGGERWSTYRSYVEPVLRRANLRVETFATARRVVLDAEGRDGLRAVGVEYEDARGQIRVVGAKREVVLTAGAVHTPQLLMLSGIGPASQLRALSIPPLRDLPVGARLMDHPDVSGVPYKCAPPLCVTDWQSRLGDLRQYRENRTGPLSAVNFPHLMSFTRSSLAKPLTGDQPDVQIQLVGRTVDGNVNCLPQDAWRLNRVVPIVSLMRPYSEGWVRLNTSNPYGRPLVKFNYFGDADGHDIAVVNEGLKLGLRLNATLATFGLTLDKDSVRDCTSEGPFGSEGFLRCIARTRTQTAWHWSGTCRMGRPGDSAAVLDSRLRVRGVRRLRVADASAIPFIPSGNINAAVIMLAERAADLIKRDRLLRILNPFD